MVPNLYKILVMPLYLDLSKCLYLYLSKYPQQADAIAIKSLLTKDGKVEHVLEIWRETPGHYECKTPGRCLVKFYKDKLKSCEYEVRNRKSRIDGKYKIVYPIQGKYKVICPDGKVISMSEYKQQASPIKQIDLSKIMVSSRVKLPISKDIKSVYVVDIPEASRIILELIHTS
jgi:hypothetical protein